MESQNAGWQFVKNAVVPTRRAFKVLAGVGTFLGVAGLTAFDWTRDHLGWNGIVWLAGALFIFLLTWEGARHVRTERDRQRSSEAVNVGWDEVTPELVPLLTKTPTSEPRTWDGWKISVVVVNESASSLFSAFCAGADGLVEQVDQPNFGWEGRHEETQFIENGRRKHVVLGYVDFPQEHFWFAMPSSTYSPTDHSLAVRTISGTVVTLTVKVTHRDTEQTRAAKVTIEVQARDPSERNRLLRPLVRVVGEE